MVIEELPSEPAVKSTKAIPSPFAIELIVGGDGAVADGGPAGATGVTLTEADTPLAPRVFTALSIIVYSVPFVKPVMVTGLVASAGFRAVKVCPLFVEYS